MASFIESFRVAMLYKHMLGIVRKKAARPVFRFNWEKAEQIGVIAALPSLEEIKILKKKLLDISINEKIKVEFLIAYTPQKGETLPINCFDPKKVNWRLIPKDSQVESFYQHQFDVLINLDQDSNYQLIYLTVRSGAKLKIGLYQKVARKINDITLDYKGDGPDPVHNLDKIISFLKALNRTDEPILI